LVICIQAGHVGVESITKDGNPFFVAANSADSAGQTTKNNINPIRAVNIIFMKTPSFKYK